MKSFLRMSGLILVLSLFSCLDILDSLKEHDPELIGKWIGQNEIIVGSEPFPYFNFTSDGLAVFEEDLYSTITNTNETKTYFGKWSTMETNVSTVPGYHTLDIDAQEDGILIAHRFSYKITKEGDKTLLNILLFSFDDPSEYKVLRFYLQQDI